MENDLLNVRACALCFSFYILILPSVSRLPSADYYCSLIKMFIVFICCMFSLKLQQIIM